MRLVRIHGIDDVRIDTVPPPSPGPRDIVVRIGACGICGSDLTYARTGRLRHDGVPFPLGHEAAGVVETVGAEVVGIRPGLRVLVDPTAPDGNVIGNGGTEGAFTDLLLLRDATLGRHVLPVPDGMTLAVAALAEPLAVGLHGVNRAGATAASQVAVFGAGPIGLGALIWLRRRGVEATVVIDISDERLGHARRLGARTTINPQREDLRARLLELHGAGTPVLGETTVGTDIFLDMAGGRSVIADIIAMAQYHARLVISAVYTKPVEFDLLRALMKELSITTAGGYPTELPEALAELATMDPVELSPYVSHSFGFDRFADAFATARSAASAKVMVEFA